MALCDYALCYVCGGKAFYDASITDDRYHHSVDEGGVDFAVVCNSCAATHVAVVRPRADLANPAAIREAALREAAEVIRAEAWPEDGTYLPHEVEIERVERGTVEVCERIILALTDKREASQ